MINIAICDDNKEDIDKAYQIIKHYFKKKKMGFKIYTYINGQNLLEAPIVYDVVFLDIEMGGLDGIKIGKALSLFEGTSIIYMTNYKEYCIQALNQTHAYAFLEKPLSFRHVGKPLMEILNIMINRTTKKKLNFEVLIVTKGGEIKKIRKEFVIGDIYYFKYINRKIQIKLKKDEYFMYGRLKDIDTKMDKFGFARCHHSIIVNIRRVTKIHDFEVFLDNEESLCVSQRRATAFRKKVNDYIQTII